MQGLLFIYINLCVHMFCDVYCLKSGNEPSSYMFLPVQALDRPAGNLKVCIFFTYIYMYIYIYGMMYG